MIRPPPPRGLFEDAPGRDFLFLFDLIAHTCGRFDLFSFQKNLLSENKLPCPGKAATLRVLSFSAPSFEQFCQVGQKKRVKRVKNIYTYIFCQPEIHKENIEKSEKKVSIKFGAARLHSTKKSLNLEVRIALKNHVKLILFKKH